MKICHLIYALNIGGAETMLVDIINEQVKTDTVCLTIINNEINTHLLNMIDSQVKVFKINRKPGSKIPFSIIKLNLLLFIFNPDVIHCHNVKGIEALLYTLKKKAVLTIHATQIQYAKFDQYKTLFAISNAVKKDILERYGIESIMIYNGIKVDFINVKKGKKDSIFRIVQVSRLDHYIKGQDILIKAIHTLISVHGIKNIKVDLIGDGPSKHFLQEQIRNLSLQNYITLLGLKDRNYVYDNLCNYDLLVQPSRYEGFGLTVAEGMVAKIPVLVSDIEGPLEVIGNGQYGFQFKTNDTDELAEQINKIIELQQSPQLNKLIKDAYDYANANFSVEQTARKYFAQYKK